MRNTYLQMCDYGSRFRILKGGKISMVVSAFIAGATFLHAAPSGGVVTSGTASIAQSGAVTTINQSTQKASINWQNFSIGASETVNFNQPNVSAITLNRVVGNEKSIINGALNANGQVWILNSNGVLFNSSAKVNTSGLLATTKTLSDEDFVSGNYSFKGESSASVINLGEIEINNGGYASLLANSVDNEGTIKALQGTVTLTGANEATINLNGNSLVSLKVDKGVLDALVMNKGAILADGGKVYLTTNAVDELLRGVVNNTGIIEAKSLHDISSEVILFAHGGTANVSGSIIADGGFVETSGKKLGVADGTVIKAKTWLLDPENIIVENGGSGDNIDADVITTALNAGTNVTLEADDDINILESIITGNMANDATLLLKAGGDVVLGQYDSGNPILIDATQNGNDNKLNVYISVANAEDNARFEMTGGSSIKTNGGNIIVGGELNGGLPNTNGTATYKHGVSLYENITIDAGGGNILIAGKGNNSEVSVSGSTLKGKDITLDAHDADLSLSGSDLQASGNVALKGNEIQMESNDIYDEDSNWVGSKDTKISANRIEVTAGDSLDVRDAVIRVNDRATFSATNGEVELDGTQILFATSGILEINAYASSLKQNKIDEMMDDWGAANVNELLEWINDDEGTSYASMDEYFADTTIQKPMFVSLKGGSYVSKAFSDGTPNTFNTSTSPIFNNSYLAFGNGLESSVTNYGMLKQPLYYDSTAQRWYKLTYSDYPLDMMIGLGGSGYNDGDLYDTANAENDFKSAVSNLSLDLSGFANNMGTIKVSMDVATNAGALRVSHSYTLESGKSFLKAVTSLTNNTGSAIDNARLWVGTQDDYVGFSDSNYKTRGNISENGFEAVANQGSDSAKALIVSESPLDGDSGAGVLFYSTTEGTNTIVSDNYRWSNIVDADPTNMPDISTSAEDGSYALYLNLGQFANAAQGSVTWYYAAAPVSELGNMVNQVGQSSGSIPTTPVTPPTPPTETPKIIDAIVSGVAIQPPVIPTFVQPNIIFQAPRPQTFSFGGQPVQLMSTPVGDAPTQIISLGEIRQMQQESAGGTDGVRSPDIRIPLGQNSLIQLVNGGLNLPMGIDQEFFMAQR